MQKACRPLAVLPNSEGHMIPNPNAMMYNHVIINDKIIRLKD